jgi:hypothetical protein
MIDELVLERLVTETAEQIPVPQHGAPRVIAELESVAREPRRMPGSSGAWMTAASVAAVLVVVVGLVALIGKGTTGSGSSAKSASVAQPPTVADHGAIGSGAGEQAIARGARRREAATTPATPSNGAPLQSGSGGGGTSSGGASTRPTDGAKIVKTGTLDLQVPHATLHTAVNRVTGVAVGLGGYIADSKSNFGEGDATAQITIRVPVNNFEAAVTQLERLPEVKVLGSSENGSDVTGQYKDLQAQLAAATTERDAFLGVLANAQSVGDILAVRDRITAVETEMNQLQGQINLLDDQATFSAIAVTLAEKPAHATKTAVSTPPTGLSKAWRDARDGFSNSLEWIIARSGGTLIILLAGLVLLFGIRYLYPVVRRGLL